MKLSKHFDESEFKCKCCGAVKVSPLLIEELEHFHEYLDKIYGKCYININSAFRCNEHNKAVGGAEKSQHKLGTAVDIKVDILIKGIVRRLSASAVHEFLMGIYKDKYGIGRYHTFTHFDVREGKARW